MNEEYIDNNMILNEIGRFNKFKEKLELECKFSIPNYIVEELVDSDNYNNLCALLNLAILNNRISGENAKIIKEKYYMWRLYER